MHHCACFSAFRDCVVVMPVCLRIAVCNRKGGREGREEGREGREGGRRKTVVVTVLGGT